MRPPAPSARAPSPRPSRSTPERPLPGPEAAGLPWSSSSGALAAGFARLGPELWLAVCCPQAAAGTPNPGSLWLRVGSGVFTVGLGCCGTLRGGFINYSQLKKQILRVVKGLSRLALCWQGASLPGRAVTAWAAAPSATNTSNAAFLHCQCSKQVWGKPSPPLYHSSRPAPAAQTLPFVVLAVPAARMAAAMGQPDTACGQCWERPGQGQVSRGSGTGFGIPAGGPGPLRVLTFRSLVHPPVPKSPSQRGCRSKCEASSCPVLILHIL